MARSPEKPDNTPIRICDKCLREYNELQEMIKKKERLQHINIRHQKFQNKIKKGFKISSRHSQVFESSPVSDNFQRDEQIENIIERSSEKGSSVKSDNANFVSPERRKEYRDELKALEDLPSCFASKSTKEKNKLRKVGFSDKTNELPNLASSNSKGSLNDNDKDVVKYGKIEDVMDEHFFKNGDEEVQGLVPLSKSNSVKIKKKSLREEIFEHAQNTHQDEFFREQEKESWSEKKKDLYERLDSLIDVHVEEIIDHFFQEKELKEIFQNDEKENSEEIWKYRFLEYTLKAIRLVKPSRRVMEDTMDINDYVEIELIEYDDDSKCAYINGCVIKNNIADRRMKSKIDNPKILLIGNSIDFFQDECFADLETYVKQENHYIDILMDRIKRAKPNVIIIEKDISRSILCKIKEEGITVVTNVQHKLLQKIARCTETLITPSVNLIEERFSIGT